MSTGKFWDSDQAGVERRGGDSSSCHVSDFFARPLTLSPLLSSAVKAHLICSLRGGGCPFLPTHTPAPYSGWAPHIGGRSVHVLARMAAAVVGGSLWDWGKGMAPLRPARQAQRPPSRLEKASWVSAGI